VADLAGPGIDNYVDTESGVNSLHAEQLLRMYPDLPRKQRETAILQECPALFITGIGYPLEDGYPHEMRAADCDDWVTETGTIDGKKTHGLNGDILVWNHVTKRRHELSSMGIRVNAQSLKKQLEMSKQTDFLSPYHQAIVKNEIPLSIGGGIGQAAHVDAVAAQGEPRRSDGYGVAENPQGHLREKEYFCVGVSWKIEKGKWKRAQAG
jgi:aspartate--ammonia ligase